MNQPHTHQSGRLTPDEEKALAQLALGHTDQVAASRLGTSRRTFRRRVRDAMDKLGARSRFQAGMLYATYVAAKAPGSSTGGPDDELRDGRDTG